MAIWGDMIKSHPEILHRVPRDIVIYDWIYGGSNYRSLKGFRDLGFAVVACAADPSCFGRDMSHAMHNIEALFHDAQRLNIKGGELTVWEMEQGSFFYTSLLAVAYAGHFLWAGRRLAFQDAARRLSATYLGLDSPAFGRLVDNLFGKIQADFRQGLASAADTAPVPYAVYDLARMRKAIYWSTSEIPEKQSPFYHLIGLLTCPTFRPEFFRRAARGVERARAEIGALRRRAKHHVDVLLVYEMTCQVYEFTLWMMERILALEKEYHQAALAKARGDRSWHRRLKGMVSFLTEIEDRYRKLQSHQKAASTRFGHPEQDVRELGVHIELARRFRRKVLALKRSPGPLPTYYRFLLEYPIRQW
jgi:hypothetical protein